MPLYAFTASDLDSSTATGVVAADTPRQARDVLRGRGLAVLDLKEQGKPRAAASASLLTRRRWGRTRVASLVRELSTLLGVGMPLLEALDTLAAGHKGGVHGVLLALRERVAAGASLAEAMRDHPEAFDEPTVQMTEVGQSAGRLDEVLEQVATFHERAAQLRGRIGAALLYPAIVLGFGVMVSVFLMTYVVPNLLDSLIEADRPLPWITRVVKGVSDFLLGYWWALLLGGGAVAMVLGMGIRTRRGRWWLAVATLRLPLVGDLLRKGAIVRIAFVVSTLMRGGVSFERAVEVAGHATRNAVLRRALERCGTAVRAGRDIGPALEASGVFPPTVVQVFALGQSSGRLEEMLDRLAVDYDRQVQSAASHLTAALEPVLIVLLAVVVGTIAFATILPILEAGRVL